MPRNDNNKTPYQKNKHDDSNQNGHRHYRKHKDQHSTQATTISPQTPPTPLQQGNYQDNASLYSAIAASAAPPSKLVQQSHANTQKASTAQAASESTETKQKAHRHRRHSAVVNQQQQPTAQTQAQATSVVSKSPKQSPTGLSSANSLPTATKSTIKKALNNVAQIATAITTVGGAPSKTSSPSVDNTTMGAISSSTTSSPRQQPINNNNVKAAAAKLAGANLNQFVNTHMDKYELRVGQFNALNLVKENEKFYGSEHYSAEKVDKKVDWISDQLKKMNCGIVGFEEVWHRETLLRCTRASGLYKDEHVYTINANGSGPTVALATIYPVVEVEAISDFPQSSLLDFNGVYPVTKFSRPVLRAVLELPFNRTVTVFVVHAKSKRPLVEDRLRHDQKAKATGHALSLVIRAAEAAALRHLLVSEMETKKMPVILVGDLNDNNHSVTTEIITGTIPWKRMTYDEKQKIWDVLLWSTNEVQVRKSDRDVTYSHIHNGRYEVLDHIMVSQQFVRTYQKHIGYIMYQQIFNDHLVDETLKDEKRSNIESDHAQVVAVIKLESDLKIQKKKMRFVAEEL